MTAPAVAAFGECLGPEVVLGWGALSEVGRAARRRGAQRPSVGLVEPPRRHADDTLEAVDDTLASAARPVTAAPVAPGRRCRAGSARP
ncbi:hypothetical protein SAMN05660350_04769 [Geodermatophilus obscurus]|uniref:Uncharacterized protein n=1 Tax=Geodermatophilus obscurus TaxID=1861 RepID=A0A1M7V0P3_9ACTN|nr:hypothetical protein [Geodermatophilus obscurus]SHN88779.1 hypothetical protein SAMN05660350_04769 [Geodermatophilus obscurus]